jgi:hypothetical protein
LIILSADSNQNTALELYAQIHERDPKQHVLVMTARELPHGNSQHTVSSVPERLLERVESLLPEHDRHHETLIS